MISVMAATGPSGWKASLGPVFGSARFDAVGSKGRDSGRVVVTGASAEGETPHEALTIYVIPCLHAMWQVELESCNVYDISMLHKTRAI